MRVTVVSAVGLCLCVACQRAETSLVSSCEYTFSSLHDHGRHIVALRDLRTAVIHSLFIFAAAVIIVVVRYPRLSSSVPLSYLSLQCLRPVVSVMLCCWARSGPDVRG